MSHIQQKAYCQKIKNLFSDFFNKKIVVDIGSLDINGNNRELFDDCLYIGIDVGIGHNVDFVCKAHELNLPDNSIDTIISTECFEHDMYYEQTLKNIYRMLKPGGLFVFTCATTGRAEHGTKRTTPQDAFLLQNFESWGDYYKNLTEQDINKVLEVNYHFSEFKFEVNEESHDLYFYGFKIGEYKQRNNYSFLMDELNKINSLYIECFYASANEDFGYNQKQRLAFDIKNKFLTFEFDSQQITRIRFDPLNIPCKIKINSITIKDLSTNLKVPVLYRILNGYNKDNYFLFDSDDPQILIEPEKILSGRIKVNIDIEYFNVSEIEIKKQVLNIIKGENENLYNQNKELYNQNQKLLDDNQKLLDDNQKLYEKIAILKNTISWRITKPLRFIRKFI